jgi:hypothetical protein
MGQRATMVSCPLIWTTAMGTVIPPTRSTTITPPPIYRHELPVVCAWACVWAYAFAYCHGAYVSCTRQRFVCCVAFCCWCSCCVPMPPAVSLLDELSPWVHDHRIVRGRLDVSHHELRRGKGSAVECLCGQLLLHWIRWSLHWRINCHHRMQCVGRHRPDWRWGVVLSQKPQRGCSRRKPQGSSAVVDCRGNGIVVTSAAIIRQPSRI